MYSLSLTGQVEFFLLFLAFVCGYRTCFDILYTRTLFIRTFFLMHCVYYIEKRMITIQCATGNSFLFRNVWWKFVMILKYGDG